MSKLPDPVPVTSALAPFSQPAFRILWGVSLSATLCTWMNDVAAGWLMTGMTSSPLMVALVQSASTLPTLVLALPLGAVADMMDRRRYILLTQLWLALVGLVSFAVVWSGVMNPYLLLALTLASGIGFAMRNPGIAGTLPETVPRVQLPQALALSSVALNVSRVIGPALAGAVIASSGAQTVYALNAVIALAGCIGIVRWKRVAPAPPAKTAGLMVAIVEGVRHAAHSPALRAVMLRTAVFYLHATIVMALLPLLARRLDPHSPTAYALMFGALGVGAVFVCLVILPRLRTAMSPEKRLLIGSILIATTMIVIALSPWIWLSTLAMFFAGMAWTGSGNTMTTQAQLSLSNALRARGMSIYLGAMMGASAVGASLWGGLAGVIGISGALGVAATTTLLSAWYLFRHHTMPGESL